MILKGKFSLETNTNIANLANSPIKNQFILNIYISCSLRFFKFFKKNN